MRKLSIAVALSLAPTAAAQDLIGVEWAGAIVTIDSFTGVTTQIGTGFFGQNDVAVVDGRIWSQRRSGAPPQLFELTTIDPVTGTATVVHPSSVDLRAMATDGSHLIWGIQDINQLDDLVTVDTITGATTTVGSTGFQGIQALAWHKGVLYAIDSLAGLLTVDPVTGLATAINPAQPVFYDASQFLLSRTDGKLVCGHTSLFEINPLTGQTTLIGPLTTNGVRGAARYFAHDVSLGLGCTGGNGTIQHSVSGPLTPGSTLVSASTNHATFSVGAALIGITPLPAPINLHHYFGTIGCSLFVTPELSAPLTLTGTTLSVSIPLGLDNGGLIFDLQHISVEPGPGGIGSSNGTRVFVGH